MVSVCMATYNGAKYIEEQLDSILIQLQPDDEIIVSDDHSTDATLQIIRSYNDPRIKIFENIRRPGILGNFENALLHASGDYLFLCDQDDIWLDGKVEKCVTALGRYALVVHDAVVVDQDGRTIQLSFFAHHGSVRGYWRNLWKNHFLGCCLAFRREMLPYILPFPPIAMHDIWIGLRISHKFGSRVGMIHEKLIAYRRHTGNASSASDKSTQPFRKKIQDRILMLYYTFRGTRQS